MIIKVPLEKIHANPYQPESRLNVPEEVAERFGKSILEHGLMQTPVARFVMKDGDITDEYEMGDGWLRLSGFKWLVLNGHPEFNEMPLDVRELTDQQMADMILEANTVRKDMTPIDEAKLYKKYLEDFGVTQAELAKSHNLTQGALANKLRLLELPADIQEKVISQEITETHGRQLLRLQYNPKLQKEALAECIKGNYTIDYLSNHIAREMFSNSRNMGESYYAGYPPAFDTSGCKECKSLQKIGEPYSSNQKSWRCLDPGCWDKKQTEAEKKKQEEIAASVQGGKGKVKVLTARDIGFNQKEDLTGPWVKEIDNPEECNNCSKTALYKYSHDSNGAPSRICLDPSCFRAKKSKKTREIHAKEKKQDQELTAKLQEAFNDLSGAAAVRNCLLVMARNLLSQLTNQEAKADMLQFFPQFPTTKGKLDVEATTKALYSSRALWTTDELSKICAAATITKQRRQYAGAISSHLTGQVRKDYAMLTGKMNDYLKEVKAFEAENCKGCGHANEELLGTGEDCCNATYYRNLNADGKCTGRVPENRFAEDPGEDKESLRKQLNIPDGIRFAEDVPDSECKSCKLDTEDHTIGRKYKIGDASYKVCLKDYRANEEEQVMPCDDCVFSKDCSKQQSRYFLTLDDKGEYKCAQKMQRAAKEEKAPTPYTPTLEPPCDYCTKGSKNGGSCDTSLYHCEDGPGSVLVCEEMAPVKPG